MTAPLRRWVFLIGVSVTTVLIYAGQDVLAFALTIFVCVASGFRMDPPAYDKSALTDRDTLPLA